MATIAEALQIAFELHQTGRFDEAETLYGRILEADPHNPQGLHLLGLLTAQLGRLEEAAALLARAIDADPLAADPRGNHGKVLRALGRPAEAIASFRTGAALRPDLWEAWEGLGHAGRETGDPNLYATGFGRAATGGGSAANHYHWALALELLDRPAEAATALERCVRIDPSSGPAVARLAALLDRMGNPGGGAVWYRRALALRPDHSDLVCNLAVLDRAAGRLEAAAAGFARAARLDPGQPEWPRRHGEILAERGYAERAAGRKAAAVDLLRAAAVLVPEDAQIPDILALTLFELGRFEEAARAYRREAMLEPDAFAAHYNGALAAKNVGALADAVTGLRIARHLSDEPWVHSTLLTTLLLSEGLDNATLDREIADWGRRFGRTLPHAPHVRRTGRPLKVGYLSGYLHPGNRLLAQVGPLLRAHDRDRLVPYVYGDAPYGTSYQDAVRPWASEWCDTRELDDAALADRIRRDGIDVLVCLIGHTRGERMTLFRHRPAPLQVSYHGMMATGVEAMDLWLSDPVLHPPGCTERFAERIGLLPHLFLFERPDDAPAVTPGPAAERGTVTFGSFNLDAKINERVVAVWSRILREIPGSRLVLKSRGSGLSDPAGRSRMAAAFARHGIGPDRLVAVPPVASHQDHLRMHRLIDIALDPFPYGGCLTSFDALTMGVPVVTLAGERFIGRMTASLLHSAGMKEWIAESEEDYIATAKTLAENRHKLTSIRTNLREQVVNSPLCDVLSYSRAYASMIETAYHTEL